MNHTRILAIDYGTKRVGLAEATSSIAQPLRVISNTSEEFLFTELYKAILEVAPEVIVVGISENEMAEVTKQFVEKFQTYLINKQLVVMPRFDFADETLSSVEVQAKLRQAGHRDLRLGAIDHYAAAQFLQEYLDLHQS